MAVCPNGHDSASDDFCDTCGMRIGGSTPAAGRATGSSPASGAPSSAWPDAAASASAAEPCPRCGTPRNGQFCEACGHNFAGPRFTPTTAVQVACGYGNEDIDGWGGAGEAGGPGSRLGVEGAAWAEL